MDVAAVRSLAGKVLESADRIAGINWATMESNSMAGSSVARAAPSPLIEQRVADVVAHLRTWAAAAQASATAIDAAQSRHARHLGEGR